MEEVNKWECFCCKNKYTDSPFFHFVQVDFIEDDKMLLSSYYQQRFVKYEGDPPPLNTSYCVKCVDQMPGLRNNFEKERTSDYLFEQNGYTCRSKEKEEAFSRDCGQCVGCNKQLILKSLFSSKYRSFFILWSPHTMSRCFPDSGTQVWKLETISKFYTKNDKPAFVCIDCIKQEKWKPCDGTITCPLCENKFYRWIFHWATVPVETGSGCYCHVYIEDGKEYVMDGYVDPIQYQWIGPKPDKFNDKPFCYKCLDKLVKDGLLRDLYEYSSSESEYDTMDPEERDKIIKTLFPAHEMTDEEFDLLVPKVIKDMY